MKVDVLNISGKPTGRQVELPAEIFGVTPNEHVVYLSVKQYLANQRQGTHKAKDRGEISGSTRKLKKQKGTGGARAGSIKNPLFRGGGRIFGPQPRNYGFKLNKKVKKLARLSVLSDRAANGNIRIVEDFTFDSPKTKSYVSILQALGVNNGKSLLVTPELDHNVVLSARNLPDARISKASDLNTYEMLWASNLIISEESIEKIKSTLTK
ncbi:MAG: 50S ribosomal protein L4 [Saprospiraceae bacterium]|jgi:large subunit ribosomal protein L4